MIKRLRRRVVLEGLCGAVGAVLAALPAKASRAAAKQEGLPMDTTYSPGRLEQVTGKGRGDFDFLAGTWTIRHRKLRAGSKDDWREFSSGATVHRVLDGLGSIEELRNPDGSFLGMGVRVWLAEQQRWADHWTSAANGIVNPPQLGRFIDGDGVFTSEETVDGTQWIYRGVWDRISPNSCRWHQSSSSDNGRTWAWDWWMEWQRV